MKKETAEIENLRFLPDAELCCAADGRKRLRTDQACPKTSDVERFGFQSLYQAIVRWLTQFASEELCALHDNESEPPQRHSQVLRTNKS